MYIVLDSHDKKEMDTIFKDITITPKGLSTISRVRNLLQLGVRLCWRWVHSRRRHNQGYLYINTEAKDNDCSLSCGARKASERLQNYESEVPDILPINIIVKTSILMDEGTRATHLLGSCDVLSGSVVKPDSLLQRTETRSYHREQQPRINSIDNQHGDKLEFPEIHNPGAGMDASDASVPTLRPTHIAQSQSQCFSRPESQCLYWASITGSNYETWASRSLPSCTQTYEYIDARHFNLLDKHTGGNWGVTFTDRAFPSGITE